jgi:ABC-type transport system substrate-binding protein
MKQTRSLAFLVLLLSLAISACQPVVQTVEVTRQVQVVQTQQVTVEATKIVQIEATRLVTAPARPFTLPDPILGNLKVRQAIAYCTNKLELIKSVYPGLNADEQARLVMSTFIPRDHWAYAGDTNLTLYPFQKDKGTALLQDAGWKMDPNTGFRVNDNGDVLTIKLTLSNSTFRQTWAAVFEQQMKACGVQVLRFPVPSNWWFGSNSGIARRDFSMGAFSWVAQPDPKGVAQWSCDQVPTPDNNWTGGNDMGWCNDKATTAIKAANASLQTQANRKAQYVTVEQEYTKDVPALPLFTLANVYAYGPKLSGFQLAAGQELWDWNIEKWAIPNRDTLTLGIAVGLGQNLSSLDGLTGSSLIQRLVTLPIASSSFTTLNYTYTANNYLKSLPSLENGLAKLSDVPVKDGDKIIDAEGNPQALKAGMNIIDANGKVAAYPGGGATMKQLAVTFQYASGIKWSDGQPLKMEDFQLGYARDCDRTSGALSYAACDLEARVDFKNDSEYTIYFRPGAQPQGYMGYALNDYPAHRVIADGPYKDKLLKDVPFKDWPSLKEITETPIGTGPYMLKEWKRGQSITFTANPNWYLGKPATPNLVIKFMDQADAESQLIAGTVDFLGSETIPSKTDALAKAETADKIKVDIIPSATWEHIDFNLFLK